MARAPETTTTNVERTTTRSIPLTADRPSNEAIGDRPEKLTVTWGAFADANIGARETQQDSCSLLHGELLDAAAGPYRFWIAGVYDGMGGESSGEIASGLAARSIPIIIAQELAALSDIDQVPAILQEAFARANRRVHLQAAERGTLGTTAAICLVLDSRWLGACLWIAHVGDSRAYAVVGNDQVALVTEDHSYVADLVKAGELTPDEAPTHPDRNFLTAALGVAPTLARFDIAYRPLQGPVAIALMSDGVWGPLQMAEHTGRTEMPGFHHYLAQAVWRGTADEAAAHLTHDAIALGGDDNATTVVLRIGRTATPQTDR